MQCVHWNLFATCSYTPFPVLWIFVLTYFLIKAVKESKKWPKLTTVGKETRLHMVLQVSEDTLLSHLPCCNSIQTYWTRHSLRITFKATRLESVKDDGHSLILTSSAPSVFSLSLFLTVTNKPHGFAATCSDFLLSFLRDLMCHIVTVRLTAYKQNMFCFQFSLVDPTDKKP